MFAAKRQLNMTAFETSGHKVHNLFICMCVYKKIIGYWFLGSITHIDFTQYLINSQHEGNGQKLCSFVMKSKHQFNPPSPPL